MPVCGKSLFGDNNNYIKVGNGQFVAVEGANTAERLMLSELRMPYDQIYKAKFTINPAEEDFNLKCFNGFTTTFLTIKVIYDSKSVIEEDNYLQWSYSKSKDIIYTMGKLMVLSGNSTNKVGDIVISNPNQKYPVTIEVMIGMLKSESKIYNTLEFFYATTESIEDLTKIDIKIKKDDDELSYIEFTLVAEDDAEQFKQRFSIENSIEITGIKIYTSPFGWTWLGGSNQAESLDWFYDNFDADPDPEIDNNILYTHNGVKAGERKIRLYIDVD